MMLHKLRKEIDLSLKPSDHCGKIKEDLTAKFARILPKVRKEIR